MFVGDISQSGNLQNSGMSSKNTSGYKGVYFCKERNLWMAFIKLNGKMKNLGRFINAELANEARIIAQKKLHPYNREILL